MRTHLEELHARLPHVEREWAQEVMTELALRDVSGERIGAALAEVESHMAERGGEVREVFGDPQEYAAALKLPDTERLSGWQWAGVWLPALLLFAGMSVLLNAVVVSLGGIGLPVLATALVFVVFLVAAVALVRCGLLRVMVKRPVATVVVLALVLAGVGVAVSLLPGPSLDLDPWVSVPAGIVPVVAALLLLHRMRRRADSHGVRLPSA